MNLPSRNKRHQYEVQLSTGVVKFQPWLVKDEQEYMYAVEGITEESEIITHIEELLSKCVDINFKEMSDIDFLKLAIEIRKRSKGSDHEIIYTCQQCDHINTDKIIDLETDVITDFRTKHPITINDLEFTIKSVTRNDLQYIESLEGDNKKRWKFIVKSIKSIAINDELFTNLSEDDIEQYLGEELTTQEFQDLVAAIMDQQDDIAVESTFTCDKCGAETVIYVDKIIDFFV